MCLSHHVFAGVASFFWGKELIEKWLGSYQGGPADGPSSVAAVEAADSASKEEDLRGNQWFLGTESFQTSKATIRIQTFGGWEGPFLYRITSFFSRKWLRIKNWLNVETIEQSQEQTNLSTVQPANPPTFLPSNLIQVLILLYKALYISSLGWYLIMDQKDERIFIRYCQSWNSVFTSSLPKSAYVESNQVFHWLKYGVCLDIDSSNNLQSSTLNLKMSDFTNQNCRNFHPTNLLPFWTRNHSLERHIWRKYWTFSLIVAPR